MLNLILELIFWLSVLSIFHSYLFYPLIIYLLSLNKSQNQIVYSEISELPKISIIMAVYNEEKIIKKKIESVINSNYPKQKLEFFIGSDASIDSTDKIIEEYIKKYDFIKYKRFENRSGKIKIINNLSKNIDSEIIIFTDANAIFDKDSIFQIIKHFKNDKIALVGGRLINSKFSKEGISIQENSYMELEFNLKHREGILWGTIMGAFGAFYAIRKSKFNPPPDNFFVDDFYISLKAIQQENNNSILEMKAIAYEDVSGKINAEFKRKVRISIGNFQNLSIFYPKLISKRKGLSFSLLSHKVLRWLSPVFIITSFISAIILAFYFKFYFFIAISIVLSMSLTIIDFFLRKIQIHIIALRFISHFYYMNTALLIGLIKYFIGAKTNVWEPTKR
ncbi:MAG: glycosyltransferase [Bacteroidales bacterium]|nr:glycosyltransferase [Bacteroidales bacterium]MBN2757530.1 glycosyltransferase [Bacteroidales bacterium]